MVYISDIKYRMKIVQIEIYIEYDRDLYIDKMIRNRMRYKRSLMIKQI